MSQFRFQTLLSLLYSADLRIDRIQARIDAGEEGLQVKLEEVRNSRKLLGERLEIARRCR